VGPRASLDAEEKCFIPLHGIEPLFLGRPARGLTTIHIVIEIEIYLVELHHHRPCPPNLNKFQFQYTYCICRTWN
jgi:hypothetical protein